MKNSVALAAMALALTAPGAVMAKSKSAGPSTSEQLSAAQQQIDALKAQLDALQARMDQQAQIQAQAADTAQAAAAKADQAMAKADAASAEVAKPAKIPDAVKWAADTKISGRMYFNISTVTAENAAGANVQKDGGFQIKRFYVGIDHKFNKVFSGNITIDVDNVIKSASLSTTSSGGNLTGASLSTSPVGQGLYIKKAYLEAKLDPAFIVRAGSTDMPWIPYVEGLYGYRHIEKTIADLNSFGTSADWGVHVMGSFADGLVSYQVSAIDGGGYRNPQFTKTVDLEGRISLKYKGFNVGIGGYTGKLGKDVQGATTFHTANRFNAALAYKGELSEIPFTIGGEYFYAKNWNRVTSVTEDSSDGYSLFASVQPVKQWSVFGRYDWVKPSKDLAPLQKDQYFNVGIQYSPAKIVDLALVYKRDKGDGGVKTGNLGTGQATRDEIGLYGQFRF
ncbi:MAG: hypothetical protein FP826_14425 [Sphingomonadales bacterium]|nr:hypothetical protein [Sphingomonadales bacterium]MBU3991685.1 hypothetical protein [Alphaproteobacteria bacterium]